MPITVQCSCGASLRANDSLAGKVAKCPKCSAPVTIPNPSAAIGGWPELAVKKATGPAEDAERIQQVIDRRTGLEASIEQITAKPYERLMLLLLCHQSETNPKDIPLNKPLLQPEDWDISEGLRNREVVEYGIDALDVAEALMAAEDLLGIELPGEDQETATVAELAQLVEQHHAQRR